MLMETNIMRLLGGCNNNILVFVSQV